MTTGLSTEQLADCHDAFSLFDHNNDGAIDASELGRVMKSLGLDPTADELMDMIGDYDFDSNGKIEYKEFMEMMSKICDKDETESDLVDAFKVFDKNDDGYITHDELRSVMKHLGQNMRESELNEMIKEADVNGDGKIDYKEFAKMMSSTN
ncbi:calmodulin-like protein [Choanephora cucurbitarum]|uniref:Calmodulin n=1 Tax=Choanephora cucurbitarum TaxID=101091 RepID=A0A1C7N2C3_9FUNG|nr:calmodulin-like protein [Choanephora cucurbitarum]OBZ83151.1 Calmodulin [Choanephora cucurbitarum]